MNQTIRISSPGRTRRAGLGSLLATIALGAVLVAQPVVIGPTGLATAEALAQSKPAPAGFADLVDKLLPAVVNISSTQAAPKENNEQGGRGRPEMPQFPPGSPFEEFFKDFFDRQQEKQAPRPRGSSLGSGFVIDAKQGYVVTNNHVIADADEITVILQDDTNIKAELVGRDPKTDLALLKIKTDHPLTQVNFGDSDAMRVGDWVVAIGNPFGLGGTVTAGIISARQRDINAGPYDDFLQTDAAINQGNSGGPMFNTNGDVIGINTAIYSRSGGSVGIGFAIPSNLARTVIGQLKEYGRTRRGWLGVRIQAVTPEIAESLGLKEAKGALVASANAGGPAAVAGILAGDVILRFDGKDIHDMRRLPRVVAETPIDEAVAVEVWRKGALKTVKVKVGELEAAEDAGLLTANTDNGPDRAAPPKSDALTEALGLGLAELTTENRQQFKVKGEAKGVLVTEVKDGSPSAEKGLRPGDVIVEVGQKEVRTPAEVSSRLATEKEQGRETVLLLVERQGDLRFVALRFGKG